MGLFDSMLTSASGLTAERLRMDLIANNLANANTTQSGRVDQNGRPLPYQRRVAVLAEREPADFQAAFQAVLNGSAGGTAAGRAPIGRGVRVVEIAADNRPFKLKYDPTHPDADEAGYVRLPNVDVVTEMVDLISASRAYEANVTALNAAKSMAMRALEIGR